MVFTRLRRPFQT